MKLIAKKPCNFGRKYFIGDEIPEECVLDPKAQEKMGVIEVVSEDDSNVDPVAGGSLLPPADTLEDQTGESDENPVIEYKDMTYSKYKLSRMNKEQLRTIAKVKGVEIKDNMTNEHIVELILESQGE